MRYCSVPLPLWWLSLLKKKELNYSNVPFPSHNSPYLQKGRKYNFLILNHKSVAMTQRTYRILLTPEEEGGFSVSVPKLPGCFTQGETVEEVVEMAKEAISLYVEDLETNKEPFPIIIAISDAEAEELLQVKRDFLAGRTKARSWEEVKNDIRNQNTQRSGHD
jgi:antitoxin HicB